MGVEERLKRLHLAGAINAALSGKAPVVRDEQGHALEVGDEVVVMQPGTYFRVAQVGPVMDPNAPPDLMRIRLVSVMDMGVPRETSISGMARTRQAVEFGTPQRSVEDQIRAAASADSEEGPPA